MEQGFHHLVRREETIRCSIALEPRSTAATHSCAVLFCAAYLGSTHGEDGKEVKLPCWDVNSASYAYGAWDKVCASKNYKFVHEPLMTTFKDVEFEAKEFRADAPLECGLESVHLIGVMSSISVYAISNQLAQARLSITSTGDAALPDDRVPRGRSSQNSAAGSKGGFVKETDIAYKGQFQTLLGKHSDTSSVFKDSVNLNKFISMVAQFRMLIQTETIDGKTSMSPFRRLCLIAVNDKVKLPYDIADYIKAQAALVSFKPPKPKVPRNPKPGSGSKAKAGLVDDDDGSSDDDEEDDMDAIVIEPRKRARLGKDEPADKGMEFKKRIAALEAQNVQLMSQNQALIDTNSKLISDQGAGVTSKQPDGTDPDAELAQLKVFDEQMMVIMSLLGACVDNLTAQDTEAESAGKKMTNVMMNLIIAQMENIYNWPAHRKRCIYMTMKTQESFKEALTKLNAEEPPSPKKKK